MDEPVIEELENLMDDSDPEIEDLDIFAFIEYEKEHILTLKPHQMIHVCENEQCRSNVFREKENCPFCGDEVGIYDKIKIGGSLD